MDKPPALDSVGGRSPGHHWPRQAMMLPPAEPFAIGVCDSSRQASGGVSLQVLYKLDVVQLHPFFETGHHHFSLLDKSVKCD